MCIIVFRRGNQKNCTSPKTFWRTLSIDYLRITTLGKFIVNEFREQLEDIKKAHSSRYSSGYFGMNYMGLLAKAAHCRAHVQWRKNLFNFTRSIFLLATPAFKHKYHISKHSGFFCVTTGTQFVHVPTRALCCSLPKRCFLYRQKSVHKKHWNSTYVWSNSANLVCLFPQQKRKSAENLVNLNTSPHEPPLWIKWKKKQVCCEGCHLAVFFFKFIPLHEFHVPFPPRSWISVSTTWNFFSFIKRHPHSVFIFHFLFFLHPLAFLAMHFPSLWKFFPLHEFHVPFSGPLHKFHAPFSRPLHK